MAKKYRKKVSPAASSSMHHSEHRLHPDTKKSVWAICFASLAVLFALAWFGKAGPVGSVIYRGFETLFGWGYVLVPLIFLLVAGVFLASERRLLVGVTLAGAALLLLSLLGLIELIAEGKGGWAGLIVGSLRIPFGTTAGIVLDIALIMIGAIVTLNVPIKIRWPEKKTKKSELTEDEPVRIVESAATPETPSIHSHATPADPVPSSIETRHEVPREEKKPSVFLRTAVKQSLPKFGGYVPLPLELLHSASEKPTTGDLRANANIIKRTLESFGIAVEMGEVNVGPKVTRYTMKPAEGIKLSRITALHQDLALALAAHPIRIEAPIPGKALVGVEVPNKAAALVRLGSLMHYPDFQKSGLLGFALGRDVTGEPIFADIERMPHLLVAGATGSGKSVAIHSLLISLLYKNFPSTLRLVLIDPKRVELTAYEGIPHLVCPVVTHPKKAIAVFRWALSEMDRRYDLLQETGSRDIKSYNANGRGQLLPFLLIVVDELADLMAIYGREVEGSIVRLAQMARATGLHLVLSTQRPSVEVITGLIKANITSRIALQVASQVDSRTILDAAGAEKLLGGGDLLFVSPEISKPKRIQGAYITEEEIAKVTDFIRKHNTAAAFEEQSVPFEQGMSGGARPGALLTHFMSEDREDDDELYDDAVRVVAEARKASASLLQRRLKVGYARAARLLDIMEERGVVGPGEGAKPRQLLIEADQSFDATQDRR